VYVKRASEIFAKNFLSSAISLYLEVQAIMGGHEREGEGKGEYVQNHFYRVLGAI